MLDEEKDLFIKKKFQQDKTISSKANNVFKNFENQILTSDKKETKSNEKVIELKSHNFFRKFRNFTAVAASFVIAVSVGAGVAIYSSVNKGKTNYTMVNIDNPSTASDYTVAKVKNEEVKVAENVEKKVSENNLIKAVLTTDGKVAIQLKKDFLNYYKLQVDTTKMYKISRITGNVKDVFVCSIKTKENPYVLLLMEDGTVEYVQVYSKVVNSTQNGYNFDFYDQGKIKGLNDVVGLEEKTEPLLDGNREFFYVNAILKDGSRKIIDNTEKVNMSDISRNIVTFKSQDGEKTYSINADRDKYVQAFGWAGASNHVYYINDNCLYYLNLVDGSKEKLATGIESVKIDDDGYIVAKLKTVSWLHRQNQYVKFEQYNVTSSKVVDIKEDDNIKVCLKADGSITVELKNGAIEKIGANKYFKENYIYNFYAENYKVSADDESQGYYSKAVAIYFGEMGTTENNYLAFATGDREVVVIDLYKYVREATGGFFEGEPGETKYEMLNGTHNDSIQELNTMDVKVTLEDGTIKDCKTIEVTYTSGRKSVIPVAPVLNKEGYKNYTINYE